MDFEYLKFKLIAMVAGILGAFIYSFFWLPPHIAEMKLFTKGFIIGSIGATVPVVMTSIILRWIGLDDQNVDYIMAVALLIGAISPMVLNFMRNYSVKTADDDIVGVVKDLKNGDEL